MSTMRPISEQLESGWENKPRTFSMATLQGPIPCVACYSIPTQPATKMDINRPYLIFTSAIMLH